MKTAKLSLNVKAGLLIFLLTSAVVLISFPNLDHNRSSTPPFDLFLGAGLAVILLTSLLFLYLGKLNLGFGKIALVLALGFNSVVAVIKLILSPHGLYLASQKEGLAITAGDPNSWYFYIIVSLSIVLLYILVFKLIYSYFVKRLARRNGNAPAETKLQAADRIRFIAKTVVIVVIGGLIIFIPLLIADQLFNPSLSYLGYIFGTLGGPLVIAIVLGIILAYRGFAAVEKQVILTGNATLLASFFWLGVSLIVLYHIMWVIFLLTLVHIWPFNTYTPK